jgi:hypothetical protein
LGEKKLQRIFAGQQFLLVMNIEIDADNACHLDAKYLQQQGFIPKALISDSRGFRIWQCDDSMARGGFALCPHL